MYTNYCYISYRTTINSDDSVDTNNLIITSKEKETNNSNNRKTKESPNNINDYEEKAKLPNEIKALSDWKFKGNKLKMYGDTIKPKAKGMIHIPGFNTNSIQLNEINQHVKFQRTCMLIFNATKKCAVILGNA